MTQDYLGLANEMIALGKPLAVIKRTLGQYYTGLDKDEWTVARQAEHAALFPTYRDMTDEEKLANDTETKVTEGETSIIERDEDYVYPQVTIDYSEVDGYLTFAEYLAEVKVLQEAIEATFDEDGMQLSTAIPAVTEQIRPYTAITAEEIEVKVLAYLTDSGYLTAKAKEEKVKAKDELVVIQDELQFQGDAGSVNYMSAVLATANFKMFQALSNDAAIKPIYDAIYGSTIGWKTADNKIEATTIENLGLALEKSMQEIAKIVGAE